MTNNERRSRSHLPRSIAQSPELRQRLCTSFSTTDNLVGRRRRFPFTVEFARAVASQSPTRLVSQMTCALADAAGVDIADVAMRTIETPASWVMEGGRVLPEPGEEAQWFAESTADSDDTKVTQ